MGAARAGGAGKGGGEEGGGEEGGGEEGGGEEGVAERGYTPRRASALVSCASHAPRGAEEDHAYALCLAARRRRRTRGEGGGGSREGRGTHRGQHRDENEDLGAEERRAGAGGDEARARGLRDRLEELSARRVRAVKEPLPHEQGRVEGARGPKDGAEGEGAEIAEEAERQEHERRDQHDARVARAQQRRGARERRHGGERVADDDCVGEAADHRLESDRRGWEDCGASAKYLCPCVLVRICAHRLTNPRNERKRVRRDRAKRTHDGQRRRKSGG